MKTFKIICITAAIIIALLGWGKYQPLVKKYNTLQKEFEEYKINKESIIDSLSINSLQLVDYYCAAENLLDSIFVKYSWPDAMDSYEYYESIENIYNYNFHVYNYMEKLRRRKIK